MPIYEGIAIINMFLALGRTFKEGLNNFWRNGWLSFATIVILTLSLYLFGVLFIVSSYAHDLIQKAQGRVDVSIYFKSDTPEENISGAKAELEKYNEIKSVDYVSKEKALETFKNNNANEPVIIKSLEEMGNNPLLASLIVKANMPEQYGSIVSYIEKSSFKEDISRVNYQKNRSIIDSINLVVSQIKKLGTILVAIFATIAILITFNTIRITIYAHRQEVEVMRLVGASNTFIRMPFVFEGIIYGAVAALLSVGVLFVTTRVVMYNLSPKISEVVTNIYVDNVFSLLMAELAFGVLLGVLSSMISIRKYLKV